jgi:hypothetical protein
MINMITVPSGKFRMGGGDLQHRPDALPTHTVNITGFDISAEPVTFDLFQQFHTEKYGKPSDRQSLKGYAVGVSWYEAAEFCGWLSEKDGKPYRLPTEAEWEYSARNSLLYDIDRMCDPHLREWCLDWYEPYTPAEKTDPCVSGERPVNVFCKVVRGGYLDNPVRYNAYPLDVWMRCSLPPSYCHFDGDPNDFGRHNVGFRVVCGGNIREIAPTPAPSAEYVSPPLNKKSPFIKRHILPVPFDNSPHTAVAAVGMNPLFRHHNHSPGLAAAPNGDLIYTSYTSYSEYDAETGIIAARLRNGAQEWDMPYLLVNPVGVNDHAPSMFTDTNGTIYLFWGWPQLGNAFPFQFISSSDNGETWSEIRFPKFTEKITDLVNQPINSVIYINNHYHVASDSKGATSVLWRSKDLINWEAPKSATGGRHTTFAALKDGRILGMGGKNSDIGGYMPQSISSDNGDTWSVTASPFAAMSSGQRPCVIRLQSGRLFMCGDYQNKQGNRPPNAVNWGSYAAYSDDEGGTWTIKPMWGTQRKKKDPDLVLGGADTLGYSVAAQTPDGTIHVVATNVHPILHFAFTEEWLLQPESPSPPDAELMPPKFDTVYTTYHANGIIKSTAHFTGKFAHGSAQTFNGKGELKTDVMFENGKIVAEREIKQTAAGEGHLWKKTGVAAFD